MFTCVRCYDKFIPELTKGFFSFEKKTYGLQGFKYISKNCLKEFQHLQKETYTPFLLFKGGTSSQGENGGPGISYFEGLTIKNLRIDNGCQMPQV